VPRQPPAESVVPTAVANASALRLDADERGWPRALAAFGLVGCVGLALLLPRDALIPGLIATAAIVMAVLVWRAASSSRS